MTSLKICLLTCLVLAAAFGARSQSLSEYTGRFTDGKDYAVYFEQTKYGLTIKPVLWTATQLLKPDGVDNFVVVDRATRGARFTRDAAGMISGVVIRGMDGEGLTLSKRAAPPLAIELFIAGRTSVAIRAYQARGAEGLTKAIGHAEQIFHRLPTHTPSVLRFLNEIKSAINADARFYALLGNVQVAAGDRHSALSNFQQAYNLDNGNADAISGLAMLGSLPPSAKQAKAPWRSPFPLSAVFAKPTAAEIKSVEDDWAGRDLKPADVKTELISTLNIDGWTANIRVVSHRVHGFRHYGAIISPSDAKPGCCPVIVEAKGVSPTYFPLELENLTSPAMMGNLRDRFIYVVPAYRGETFNFKDKTFTSEGDRRDALDGATDDAIALLSVAIQTTPEIDAKRICAFGRSRGGTVALLMGIRDPRIKCVANWSGPTDWFYAMGTEGWSEQELWSEGLRIHATPLETGGQNLERFLSRAIEGKADLAAVRHNMIASSPLYFARRLGLSQHHYGLEDTSVPSRNGTQLVERLKNFHRPYTAFFYPNEGHDTDRINAPVTTRKFIADALGVK